MPPAAPLAPFPWIDVLIIALLIALNGVFAMSDLAIVSSREARLKAMVKTGLGITIIPYQAVAADVRSRRLFSRLIAGQALIRETGWIYPKMSRLPRTVSEVLTAFERVKPKLRAPV